MQGRIMSSDFLVVIHHRRKTGRRKAQVHQVKGLPLGWIFLKALLATLLQRTYCHFLLRGKHLYLYSKQTPDFGKESKAQVLIQTRVLLPPAGVVSKLATVISFCTPNPATIVFISNQWRIPTTTRDLLSIMQEFQIRAFSPYVLPSFF